jgi:E3 ubiquitin-protein ligase listerin
LHPSRRIRLLAATLHGSLLHIPSLRSSLLANVRGELSSDDASTVLGAWCLLAHDVDRAVAAAGRLSWASNASLLISAPELQRALFGLVQRAVPDPTGAYAYVNPPPPVPPVQQGRGAKGRQQQQPVKKPTAPEETRKDDDEEHLDDRKARLRIGALGALAWILGACLLL